MTGTTTWNKSTAPAGADGWNLTTDVRKAIETLNTPVPVASAAERDALTPPSGTYPGMQVIRTDLDGFPVQTWDGAKWNFGTQRIMTSVGLTDWAFNVTLSRHWNDDGTKSVTMGLIVARIGGTPFTVGTGAWTGLFPGLIPAGWRPNDNIYTCGGYEFAPSGRVTGAVLLQVRTTGQVDAQGVTDTINMGQPTKLTASAHWTAA